VTDLEDFARECAIETQQRIDRLEAENDHLKRLLIEVHPDLDCSKYGGDKGDCRISLAIGDIRRALEQETVYDRPCFCTANKGSEPGHVHSSQPSESP
jgi:hypothetical protein